MSPHEHFEFLVAQGIIDRSGRVLVARLFGDSDTDGTEKKPTPTDNGQEGG